MKNFWIDIILFALFVAEMSFHFLPKILHEILGLAMAALMIYHVAINFRRLTSLTKKISPRKIFSLAINFGLIICAVVTLITGLFISNYIFVDAFGSEWRRIMLIHQLHVAAPYLMLILIGVHVGLHWRELWQRFLNLVGLTKFYSERRNLFRAAAVVLSAVGVVGFFLNRVGDRLLMKHIFGTPATELPAVIFILLMICGVGFYALITVLLDEKFSRKGHDY